MLNDNTRLIRSDEVLEAELDDEAVLLHVESGRYFEVNVTGKRIWSLLSRETDPATILSSLVSGAERLKDEERKQVISYLETLVGLDLARAIPT